MAPCPVPLTQTNEGALLADVCDSVEKRAGGPVLKAQRIIPPAGLVGGPLPSVDTGTQTTSGCGLRSGHGSAIGPRPTMEDEVICADSLRNLPESFPAPAAFYAVMDGHAGSRAATLTKHLFTESLVKSLTHHAGGADGRSPVVRCGSHDPRRNDGGAHRGLARRALVDAFADVARRVDAEARKGHWEDGTTVCSVLVLGRSLAVANLGDSRAVLGRGGRAVALSTDHKPDTPEELRRIVAAGGCVTRFPGDCARVNGELAVSRALGDVRWKYPVERVPSLPARFVMHPATVPAEDSHPDAPRPQTAEEGEEEAVESAWKASVGRQSTDADLASKSHVSATPDVRTFSLAAEDEFLVIACDGVWDVMTDQQVVDLAGAHLCSGTPAAVAHKLVCASLEAGSMDNVSVIVVPLDNLAMDGT